MVDLEKQIVESKKGISVDAYPMSIGELASIYKEGELNLHPDFQRIYRWEDSQKSKLIESILLGIPIPSIFVAQDEKGVWDVIDGVQRLSTIFQFMGILMKDNGELEKPLKLVKPKILTELESKTWEGEKSISKSLQLVFKREKLSVNIIKKESHSNFKYELFQRLNSLGTQLSNQELRNCLIIMIDKSFYLWLKLLAENKNFLNCISLSEKLIEEEYHMELVLRYLVFKNMNEGEKIVSVEDYLSDKTLEFINSTDFDREQEKINFEKTFKLLNEVMGEKSFKRYNVTKMDFEGKFLLSAFETISIGIGSNIDLIVKDKIKDIIINMWNDTIYEKYSGSGVNVNSRIKKIIPLGKKMFSNV